MLPIRTRRTTGIYGAPPGLDAEVGGLPYWRTHEAIGPVTAPVIYSVWEPTQGEREAIAGGANILLGITGEPIPPVSLSTIEPEAPADNWPPKPPPPSPDRQAG